MGLAGLVEELLKLCGELWLELVPNPSDNALGSSGAPRSVKELGVPPKAVVPDKGFNPEGPQPHEVVPSVTVAVAI